MLGEVGNHVRIYAEVFHVKVCLSCHGMFLCHVKVCVLCQGVSICVCDIKVFVCLGACHVMVSMSCQGV